MRLMKITVIISILCIFASLTCCSESNIKYDDLNVAKLEKTTLKIYFLGTKPTGLDEVIAEAEKRTASDLNAALGFEFLNMNTQSYYSQIHSIISSGQQCDAFMMYDTGRGTLESFVRDEIAADITNLMPNYAPEIFSQVNDTTINFTRVKNRIYAVPRLYPIAQRLGVAVRQDLLEKYKVSSINNYDQMESFLEKIKQNEPDIYPLTTYNTTLGLFAQAYGYVILDYETGLVYKWADKDMVIHAWEQTPEFKEAENRLAYWYREKYISPGHNINYDDIIFTTGKWAVIIRNMGDSVYYNINSDVDDNSSGFKYAEFPLYPEQPAMKVSPTLYSFVISNQSKNKERVLMFFNWIQSSKENYRLFRYGLEDRDYQVIKDSIGIPRSASSVNKVFATWPGSSGFINMKYEGPYWIGGKSFDIQKFWESLTENTDYAPHGGFVPDYTPVSKIQIARKASFTRLVQKMERGLYQENDPDEYINDMKNINTDELVRTIQMQLDAWKSRNGN